MDSEQFFDRTLEFLLKEVDEAYEPSKVYLVNNISRAVRHPRNDKSYQFNNKFIRTLQFSMPFISREKYAYWKDSYLELMCCGIASSVSSDDFAPVYQT